MDTTEDAPSQKEEDDLAALITDPTALQVSLLSYLHQGVAHPRELRLRYLGGLPPLSPFDSSVVARTPSSMFL